MHEKTCQGPDCKKLVPANRPQGKYCSDWCRRQAYIERRAQRIEEARKAESPTAKPYCPMCGKVLQKDRKDAVFCSTTCKQLLWRFQHGEADSIMLYYGPDRYPVVLWAEDHAEPMPWELDK